MKKSGFVYIITNKSMPELIKVGHTYREGKDRAKELSVTGLPHKYEVVYECLIENPHLIEKKAHKNLEINHVGKEWFKSEINDGIIAIKNASDGNILYEKNYISGETQDYREEIIEKNEFLKKIDSYKKKWRKENKIDIKESFYSVSILIFINLIFYILGFKNFVIAMSILLIPQLIILAKISNKINKYYNNQFYSKMLCELNSMKDNTSINKDKLLRLMKYSEDIKNT